MSTRSEVQIADAARFAPGDRIQLGEEVVVVTAVEGDILTIRRRWWVRFYLRARRWLGRLVDRLRHGPETEEERNDRIVREWIERQTGRWS